MTLSDLQDNGIFKNFFSLSLNKLDVHVSLKKTTLLVKTMEKFINKHFLSYLPLFQIKVSRLPNCKSGIAISFHGGQPKITLFNH